MDFDARTVTVSVDGKADTTVAAGSDFDAYFKFLYPFTGNGGTLNATFLYGDATIRLAVGETANL